VIYDISPPISPSWKVWPGDTPLSREVLLDMKRGDNITLSALHATVHLGSHVDAPSHYGVDAPSVDCWPVERLLGPCEVVRVEPQRGTRMAPDILAAPVRAARVLFATGTYPDPTDFNEDFAAFSPALIDKLAAQGATVVGIDTPSVDLFASKDMEAHHACLRHDIAILEGIVLKGVPAGVYELIALPLKLVGFDASPVRAVLREIER
jgi:arylformamidase